MMTSRPGVLFPALGVATLLAACGDGGSDAPARSTSPEPMRPVAQRALSDEARAALLASLPEPYSAGDLDNGRRVFARCRACHTVPEGGSNLTGPNLWGLFGREAGTLGTYNYSAALRDASFHWDAAQLDDWLANPRTFLPGNKMAFAGVRDETDRRDLIAWLKVETGYGAEG